MIQFSTICKNKKMVKRVSRKRRVVKRKQVNRRRRNLRFRKQRATNKVIPGALIGAGVAGLTGKNVLVGAGVGAGIGYLLD